MADKVFIGWWDDKGEGHRLDVYYDKKSGAVSLVIKDALLLIGDGWIRVPKSELGEAVKWLIKHSAEKEKQDNGH